MDHVQSLMRLALEVLAIILLADFTGGLFHWAEDTLGAVDTPIWGKLFVAPNVLHHDNPGAILNVPLLPRVRMVLAAWLVLMLAAWLLDLLTWQVVAFLVLAAFNDQAHVLQHTPTGRVPRLVLVLRRAGILQSARHHWQHHKAPHTSHYCVLTPWVNPVLDRLGFWRGMERVFVPIFGAPRRPDLA
jgi:hypothetical protein